MRASWTRRPIWRGRGRAGRLHAKLDRLLGYGLKDATGFKHTHLNRV